MTGFFPGSKRVIRNQKGPRDQRNKVLAKDQGALDRAARIASDSNKAGSTVIAGRRGDRGPRFAGRSAGSQAGAPQAGTPKKTTTLGA